MTNDLFNQSGPLQTRTLLFVTAGMVVIIGSALAFEHLGGYAPCALCLEQRTPYYWGIPFMLIGCVSALMKWPACLVRGMLMIGVACLLATAAMGIYHAGVEWKFWEGPATCSAGLTGAAGNAKDLLASLSQAKAPSCADAAGRFLGLSFAGWNVVGAGILAIIGARGAFGPAR